MMPGSSTGSWGGKEEGRGSGMSGSGEFCQGTKSTVCSCSCSEPSLAWWGDAVHPDPRLLSKAFLLSSLLPRARRGGGQLTQSLGTLC